MAEGYGVNPTLLLVKDSVRVIDEESDLHPTYVPSVVNPRSKRVRPRNSFTTSTTSNGPGFFEVAKKSAVQPLATPAYNRGGFLIGKPSQGTFLALPPRSDSCGSYSSRLLLSRSFSSDRVRGRKASHRRSSSPTKKSDSTEEQEQAPRHMSFWKLSAIQLVKPIDETTKPDSPSIFMQLPDPSVSHDGDKSSKVIETDKSSLLTSATGASRVNWQLLGMVAKISAWKRLHATREIFLKEAKKAKAKKKWVLKDAQTEAEIIAEMEKDYKPLKWKKPSRKLLMIDDEGF